VASRLDIDKNADQRQFLWSNTEPVSLAELLQR
jgi:hypothetical protein